MDMTDNAGSDDQDVDGSTLSDSATANRMRIEAAETAAPSVQEIVDELSDSHEGEDVEVVADAVQEKWTEKFGEQATPIPDEDAVVIAEHIAAGDGVTIVPPKP